MDRKVKSRWNIGIVCLRGAGAYCDRKTNGCVCPFRVSGYYSPLRATGLSLGSCSPGGTWSSVPAFQLFRPVPVVPLSGGRPDSMASVKALGIDVEKITLKEYVLLAQSLQ